MEHIIWIIHTFTESILSHCILVVVVCSCDNDGEDSSGSGGCAAASSICKSRAHRKRKQIFVFKNHIQYQVYTRFCSTKCNMNRLLYAWFNSLGRISNHSFCLLYSGIAGTGSSAWVCVSVWECTRAEEEKRDERNEGEIGIRRARDSHKYMHAHNECIHTFISRSMHADTNTYAAETKRVSVRTRATDRRASKIGCVIKLALCMYSLALCV